MGVVYEATRQDLGLSFALKFLHPDRLEGADDRSFTREVLCSSALRHENIVQLLDVGVSPRGAYAVFELVSGSTLSEVLDESGALDPLKAVGIMQQVGRALCCAHASGVTHRDLKASNVMLTRHADGRDLVKVLDFGIARLPQSATTTPTEGPAGTAAYMAPEVARGESRGDALSDVYSMGVLLYELLSGHRPHHGTSLNALLHSVMTKPPAPLEDYRAGLPACLRDFVQRTISPNPRDRPQTAADFVEELCALDLSLSQLASHESPTAALPSGPFATKSEKLRPVIFGATLGGVLSAALILAAASSHETSDKGPTALSDTHSRTKASGEDERGAAPSDNLTAPLTSPSPPRGATGSPAEPVLTHRTLVPAVSEAIRAPAASPPSIRSTASARSKRLPPTEKRQPLLSSLEFVSDPLPEKVPDRIDETTGFVLRNPYE